jgi:hypothetical protein
MVKASAESAKQFFLAKIEEQATLDGTRLSALDRTMFVFAEASASETMLRASQEFHATSDAEEYEKRVACLLRRAYRRDKKSPDGRRLWREALKGLRGEDFYGGVMLEQAGLTVPGEGLLAEIVGVLPHAAIFIGLGVPGFLLVVDPFQWRVITNDWIRVVLLPVFAFAIWWAEDRYSRRGSRGERPPNG